MTVSPIVWTQALVGGDPTDVEAGTLLGVGRPAAADLVGEGAVAVARPGGRVEIRAARDGVPSLCADGVVVGRRHERGGGADGAVRGSLRVEGYVGPGRALRATGPMRVEGDIDRAEVRAGGELRIEGRATGADLSGGALAALRTRLHEPLLGMGAELDRWCSWRATCWRRRRRGGARSRRRGPCGCCARTGTPAWSRASIAPAPSWPRSSATGRTAARGWRPRWRRPTRR